MPRRLKSEHIRQPIQLVET